MNDLTCAVLIYDRKASAATGTMVRRPCGAKTTTVVASISGDAVFAACHRHERRLVLIGIGKGKTR